MREMKKQNFKNKKFRNQINKPKVKTRKDLRKEKRLQEKVKRHNNFIQRQKFKNKKITGESKKADKKEKSDDFYDEEDEEIPSDFEDQDNELTDDVTKSAKDVSIEKNSNKTQLEIDRMKDMEEQKEYENEMKKKRIEQMMESNEDDDKIIKKYEKLLKLNKRKSKTDVPLSFNDGLDYALELCTPENIQKMYTAAKEAAELEEDSDNDFIDDLDFATGKSSKGKRKLSKNVLKTQGNKTLKKMEKLKETEKKYFGEDLDEFDSLQGSDSEFDEDDDDGDEDEQLDDNDAEFPSDTEVEDSGSDVEEEPINKKSKNGKQVNFNLKENKSYEIERTLEKTKADNKSKPKLQKEISVEYDSTEDVDENSDGESSEDLHEEDEIDEESSGSENSEVVKTSSIRENTGEAKDWEDIYGRKRDKDGNILQAKTEKYIPPHLRVRLDAENSEDPKRKEKLSRLQKQLKGLMNRLAESNMHRIVIDIDNMYMQNARFDMNNIITNLLIDALVSNSLSAERMILEHTCLIACLHANVGSEVGAHFLQRIIEKFDKMMKEIDNYDVENKELDNVIFIICHLYTFNIFKHNMIYEILDILMEKLTEKSVECILLVLKSIGFVLRKDDPIALKNFIIDIQKRANLAPPELRNNSRVKFMLDILLTIKNNNIHKMPQYDPSLAENFRKLLKTVTTNGKYVSTLNININDLLNADEKGKWWLVGSAWSGGISKSTSNGERNTTGGGEFSQKLLELAKKQRMNTDDRRNVFCILMSAEDYIDAFEKLIQLTLRDHRIIVTVIIHCCLSEKEFNPYYAVLAQKFSDHDRKYQLALQFALWDKIKELSSLTASQIKNLGKFLTYVVEQGGLPLSVLKIIEFGELDKITLRFVRQIMLGILLGKEEICKQIFTRIAPSTKLSAFKDSIRLFMRHFLLEKGSKVVSGEQLQILKKRINLVDRCMEMYDSRIKF